MSTDRTHDREAPKAFRDDDKTIPSPVIRGATGHALATGRVLDDRYTLVERIGAGGWGEVWRAVQNSTRREVALKILRWDVAEEDMAKERFQLEAEAVSQLVHQNTVTLFDYGHTAEGETYMAMELLDGDSLDQVLRKTGPMAPDRALRVVRQVALSLDEAHGKGIIHRDVKPHNIMLLQRPGEPDFAKVLDFGVAKWVLEDHQLTSTGTTFGTPEYMSPEQVQSKPLDHRTDLYSVGVILYTLLAARPPFRGESPITVALEHINTRLPPLPQGVVVPRAVDRLMRSLTSKDPTKRPFSAAEVAELCDGILQDMEQGTARPARRGGPWIALLLGLLVGTVVFAIWRPWEGSAVSGSETPPTVEEESGSETPPAVEPTLDSDPRRELASVTEAPPPTVEESGPEAPPTAEEESGPEPPPAVEESGPEPPPTAEEESGSETPPTVEPEPDVGGPSRAESVRVSRDLGRRDAPPTKIETATITITSKIKGAVATLPDGAPCPCPCRLERPVGDRLKVSLRAPDHEERRMTLRFRGGDKAVPAKLAPVPLSERDGLKGDDAPSSTDGLK
jgi:serine/threonine protein kinase